MEYIIYKIVCNDLEVKEIYVGSTRQFTKRKCRHKHNCNNENCKSYNQKVYQTIRNNGGWQNWTMVKIEDRVCETTLDARRIEREWFEKLNADMNMQYPQRNHEEVQAYQKEYREINREHNKEYQKEYHKNNFDQNREQRKVYMKEYREINKDKTKDYYKQNKQRILDYRKEYYKINKEKIKEQQQQQQITCECGGYHSYTGRARHEKTIKHQNYICNKISN